MSKPPIDDVATEKVAFRKESKEKDERDLQDFLQRFATASERGAALSMVSYLDTKVTSFVANMWVSDDNARANMMRSEGGALGSLGSKINLCYLSGWISKVATQDLSQIVKIRNRFAHEFRAEGFADAEIRSHCAKMSIFRDPVQFFGGGEDAAHQMKFYSDIKYDISKHRWGFMAAVGFLGNRFQTNNTRPLNIRTNFIRCAF